MIFFTETMQVIDLKLYTHNNTVGLYCGYASEKGTNSFMFHRIYYIKIKED